MSDPRFLGALVVLLVNDHWAKAAHPGLVTGKLSDVAGMIVLPVLLSAIIGVAASRPVLLRALPGVLSGALLIGIKTSAAIAASVEAALEAVTGWQQTIVVDPTDLVGLAGLVVADVVIRAPRPIRLSALARPLRALGFVAAVFACTATSYEEDSGWIHLEEHTDGTIVAAGYRDEPRQPIASTDGGRTWHEVSWEVVLADERVGGAQPEREPAGVVAVGAPGPQCLSGDAAICVRVDARRPQWVVEESIDGGQTWESAWTITDGDWLTESRGLQAFIALGEVLVTSDGAVLVAAAHLEPLRRDPSSGQWSPDLATVQEAPGQYAVVAVLTALALFGAVRLHRAPDNECFAWAAGAGIVAVGGMMATAEPGSPGTIVGVPAVGVVCLAMLASLIGRLWQARPSVASVITVLALAVVLVVGVLGPFLLFEVGQLDWSQAKQGVYLAVLLGPIVVGMVGPRPTARARRTFRQPPPPPTPNARGWR